MHSFISQKIVLNNSSQKFNHPTSIMLWITTYAKYTEKKDNAKLLHLLHTVGNQRVESNFHLFNTENVKWTGEFSSSLWPLLYTVQVGDPNYPVSFILNLHISSKSARKRLIIACEQETPVYSIMYLTKQSWQPVKCSFTFSKLYGM